MLMITHMFILDDPNRATLDPDKLARGVAPFLRENKNCKTACRPLYDFFVRYVRKLHSDQYLKTTLKNNPGKSFLDVIGPSDVAYVIALLKNSVDVWKRDWGEDNTEDIAEIAEQDTQTKKTAPKPLFTRGEKVKRKFGRTAWSEEGMEYYKNTLAVWKRMFDRRQAFYGVMSADWDDWLTEEATVMNPNGWTRKDLQSLLETRSEREVDNSLKQDNSKHAEEDYYSEDEGGPMIGFGIEVREGAVDDEEQFDGKSRDDESYDDNERGGNGMENEEYKETELPAKSNSHEDGRYDDDDEIESDEDNETETVESPPTKKRRTKKDKSPTAGLPPRGAQTRSARGGGK